MADLTQEQKQTVTGWILEGAGLAEVQSKLRDLLGVSLTYMDVRLLVLELGLKVREAAKPPPVPDLSKTKAGTRAKPVESDDGGAAWDEPEPEPAGPSGGSSTVSVSVDRLIKPGSVVSGSVTFSDGVTATWGIDQFGRLMLSAGRPGYKPSHSDVLAFQTQLRKVLEQKGF
jgi:hypothetical protein